MGVSQTTAPGKTFDWAPRPSAMPLVTAGQQPVFADDRTAFDALSQTNLDLRQIVFLPPEARGSISATQQTAARVLDAKFANQSISIQTEAPAASLVVISQSLLSGLESLCGWPASKNLARQLCLPGGRGAGGTAPSPTGLRRQDSCWRGRSFPAWGCWPAPGSGGVAPERLRCSADL